jgi:PIN domain nuclease of toxin-antitoxin system
MQYLLDTHTLLWFLQDDPQLPERVSNEITNIDNKCYVSIASLWEIAIKINLGKLSIKFPFEKFASFLSDNDIELLPIAFDHLIQLSNLELHHRDPFDRVIIAQSMVENLTIITKDGFFPSYTIKLFWK